MNIPEPNIDMKRIESLMNKIGDIEYDKLMWWRKGQWVVYIGKKGKLKQYQLFDHYEIAVLFAEIIKLKEKIK